MNGSRIGRFEGKRGPCGRSCSATQTIIVGWSPRLRVLVPL